MKLSVVNMKSALNLFIVLPPLKLVSGERTNVNRIPLPVSLFHPSTAATRHHAQCRGSFYRIAETSMEEKTTNAASTRILWCVHFRGRRARRSCTSFSSMICVKSEKMIHKSSKIVKRRIDSPIERIMIYDQIIIKFFSL